MNAKKAIPENLVAVRWPYEFTSLNLRRDQSQSSIESAVIGP